MDIITRIPVVHESFMKLYKDVSTEFEIGNWTFFSISDIEKHQHDFTQELCVEPKMLDIAYLSLGMGHVVVLSYIPKTDNFCVRSDGGSNGYEREINEQNALSNTYIPANFPIYMNEHIKFQPGFQYSYDQISKILPHVKADTLFSEFA